MMHISGMESKVQILSVVGIQKKGSVRYEVGFNMALKNFFFFFFLATRLAGS